MRIASSLVAFTLLGVAAAGVIPGIRLLGRNGGEGGHSSVSGVHHSGIPTGTSLLGGPSRVPGVRRGGPSVLPSIHPTGSYSHSGSHSPSGTPDHVSSHPHAPASRREEPTPSIIPSIHPSGVHSHLPSGTPDHVSSQPHAPASRRAEPSGSHSRASDYPTPSGGSSHSAHPSGKPSDATLPPLPSKSVA